MSPPAHLGPRGAPLALFALLLTGWVGGRAMLWESPVPAFALSPSRVPQYGPASIGPDAVSAALPVMPAALPPSPVIPLFSSIDQAAGGVPPLRPATLAAPAADVALLARGLSFVPPPREPFSPVSPSLPVPPANSAAPEPTTARRPPDRWTVDAWGFYRQGSDLAPISQGRVPIYGASQLGAISQYRIAPQLALDPRIHVRGYRAMVTQGETEVSVGGSLRPLRAVPIRAFAELRYTETAVAADWRPAAYAVTELPLQTLPGGWQLEAYAQAGWVGGQFATAFADGQASLTHELTQLTASGGNAVRISAGAGAWGGAQKDARRIDVGPTVRIDWTMGRFPARLSVDWRERVGGDATPPSGMAATLSAGF